VQAAIESQFTDMVQGADQRKVGVVTFNGEVQIIGDGTQDPEIIAGDKLMNFEYLEENGKKQGKDAMQNLIKETKPFLSEKLMKIEETGPTALGPAALTAIAMASQGAPGSTVVLCTDGLANVGLGAWDEVDTPEEAAKVEEFYERLGVLAKTKGVTINVISIAGDECNLDSLEKMAEATGGEVERVKPTTLT